MAAAMVLDDTGRVLPKISKRFLPKDRNALAFTTPGGEKVTMGELARRLVRNNVVRNQNEIFEATGKVGGKVPVEGMPLYRQIANYWSRAGRGAGGYIENEARIAAFIGFQRRGMSETEAMKLVNDVLFDYDALSDFERQYLKRAVPFYVWTKKNIALQAKAIRNQPGRVVNPTKAFNNEDPDVTDTLATWELEGLRLQVGRDGKHVRMVTGIDLPISNVDRLLPIGKIIDGNLSEALRDTVGVMTPLLKVPMEVATKTEFFSGRSLDRVRSSTVGRMLDPETPSGRLIPQSTREWLGYKKTTFPGNKVSYDFDGIKFHLIFRSWVMSRYLSSSDRWFNDMAEDPGVAAGFLTFATSLKDNEIDLDEARFRQMGRRIKRVQDALLASGDVIGLDKVFVAKPNKRRGVDVSFGTKDRVLFDAQGRRVR